MLKDKIKIIIVIMIGIGIIGFFISQVTKVGIFRRGYIIKTYFDYISGLNVGNPVRLAGMEVGYVKALSVKNKNKESKVEVILWIDDRIKIRRGAYALITSLGVVGEKYVEIFFGREDLPYIRSGEEIPTINPVHVEEMLYKMRDMVLSLEKTTAILDSWLKGKDIKNTVEKVSSLANHMSQIAISAQTLFTQLKYTVNKINNIFEKVENKIDNFQLEKLNESIIYIKETSRQAQIISTNLQNILKDISTKKGALGRMLYDEELAENLTTTIKNLAHLSEELKDQPLKFLLKSKKKDDKK